VIWARWAAMLMAAAVVIGAFAAHALKGRLTPEAFQTFEVGVRYHIYHALALFVVAWLGTVREGPLLNGAGICFLLGIAFFSGSLYGYALSGITRLALLAPVGGSLFIAGWVLVFLAVRKA
jgi:uncharacterized membrane protein YgdD (TMEM256/DUF423 family)